MSLNSSNRTDYGARFDATWAFVALSVVLNIIAIVSLVAKLFDIGLAEAFAEVVDFYRKMIHPIYEAVANALGLSPPSWAKDLWTISFLNSGAYFRALASHRSHLGRASISNTASLFLLWLAAGTSFAGLFVIYLVVAGAGWSSPDQPDQQKFLRLVSIYWWAGVVGAAIFFVINSQT